MAVRKSVFSKFLLELINTHVQNRHLGSNTVEKWPCVMFLGDDQVSTLPSTWMGH